MPTPSTRRVHATPHPMLRQRGVCSPLPIRHRGRPSAASARAAEVLAECRDTQSHARCAHPGGLVGCVERDQLAEVNSGRLLRGRESCRQLGGVEDRRGGKDREWAESRCDLPGEGPIDLNVVSPRRLGDTGDRRGSGRGANAGARGAALRLAGSGRGSRPNHGADQHHAERGGDVVPSMFDFPFLNNVHVQPSMQVRASAARPRQTCSRLRQHQKRPRSVIAPTPETSTRRSACSPPRRHRDPQLRRTKEVRVPAASVPGRRRGRLRLRRRRSGRVRHR